MSLQSIMDIVAETLKHVAPPTLSETISIDTSLARVSSQPVLAEKPLPEFKQSAMDGYAVNSASPLFQAPPPYQLSSLTAKPQFVPVATGGIVSDDFDAVLLKEQVTLTNHTLTTSIRPTNNQWIRDIGSNIQQNSTLLPANKCINAYELAQLISSGTQYIKVFPKPKIALLSTGNELVEHNQPKNKYQIYDCNRPMLRALLNNVKESIHISDLGIMRDSPQQLLTKLKEYSHAFDLIISSGGTSMGDSDPIKKSLHAFDKVFYQKLPIKPGKPTILAKINQATLLALPGNPVSCATIFEFIAKPIIQRIAGNNEYSAPWMTCHAEILEDVSNSTNRIHLILGIASWSRSSNTIQFLPLPNQNSHILHNLTQGNAFLEIPTNTFFSHLSQHPIFIYKPIKKKPTYFAQ